MILRTLPENRPFGGRQTGFTLVELVVVILLIGILAAVGLPRFFGTDAYTNRAAVDRTISAFRFAQQQALSRFRTVRVRGGSEALIMEVCSDRPQSGNLCPGSWEVLQPPTSSAGQWDLGASISLPGGTVFFNSLGRVVDSSGSPQTGSTTVNVGGSTVKVVEATGLARAT